MPHVAYCFDEKYTPYFAASVFSLVVNYKSDISQLVIHVVTDELHDDLVKTIAQLRNISRAGFDVHTLQGADLKALSRLPIPPESHYSPASYLRLFLPSILDHGIDRVLYVDADTIVVDDVSGLFDLDLNGSAIGAVKAYSSERTARRLGLESTINSGVMVIDLAVWRQREIESLCVRWLSENPKLVKIVDEDAINVVLSNSIHLLDGRWNFQVKSGQQDEHPNPAIFHFIGPIKPWHAWYDGKHGMHYWHYANACPWKPAAPQQPGTARDLYRLACLRMKQGNHAEAMQCYERLFRSYEQAVNRGQRPR